MPTALIAEDEALLRTQLHEMLIEVWPELDIVALAADGPQAQQLFELHRPDILFLDIRMPGRSGLELARACSARAHVVFVSAHDEHAIAAFEQGVVDYVLKPLDRERLRITVQRLQRRLSQPPRDLRPVVDALDSRAPDGPLRWIQASTGNQLRFITVDDVAYFQADTKYTRVATSGADAFIRKPIKDLAAALDPDQFWQIHRGTLLNLAHVDRVVRSGDGVVDVLLKGRPEKLSVSQAYQARFRQM